MYERVLHSVISGMFVNTLCYMCMCAEWKTIEVMNEMNSVTSLVNRHVGVELSQAAGI